MKIAFLVVFLVVLVLQLSDDVDGEVLRRLNRNDEAASPVVHEMHHDLDVDAVESDVQPEDIDRVETASGGQGVDDDDTGGDSEDED